MGHKRKGFVKTSLLFALTLAAGYLLHDTVWPQDEINKETLLDGVEHWYRVKEADKKPWFFKQVENILAVILPGGDKLPFGESVAFLVGVGQYEHISPQLPFVENDLNALREFLLNRGGFDAVYVARNQTATPELVKDYMVNKFRKSLKPQDRLLFYYSGHGADLGGNTGYMQFSHATPDDLARHVLRIDECEEWSKIIPVKHILFIYDCCLSGLAFTPKFVASDDYKQILRSLSGDGSRTVITAGTAEENTFGVGENSVFTAAFLRAFQTSDEDTYGFMTTNQIFARLERHVKEFARRHNKQLTPRRWELQENEYRGAFVFINPAAKNVKLPKEYAEVLQAKPKGQVVGVRGIIRLTAYMTGKVYIDSIHVDNIESGDVKEYVNYAVGEHKVEVQSGAQTATGSVTVEKGRINDLTIRPAATIPPVVTLAPPRLTRDLDGAEMVLIPAGPFKMGTAESEVDGLVRDFAEYNAKRSWFEDEVPQHTVYLDDFYIDKYEVTNAQFKPFIDANPEWRKDRIPSKYHDGDYLELWNGNDYPSGKGDHPVVSVSWYAAAAYAQWVVVRLPTEAEWEKAARGAMFIACASPPNESPIGAICSVKTMSLLRS